MKFKMYNADSNINFYPVFFGKETKYGFKITLISEKLFKIEEVKEMEKFLITNTLFDVKFERSYNKNGEN